VFPPFVLRFFEFSPSVTHRNYPHFHPHDRILLLVLVGPCAGPLLILVIICLFWWWRYDFPFRLCRVFHISVLSLTRTERLLPSQSSAVVVILTFPGSRMICAGAFSFSLLAGRNFS